MFYNIINLIKINYMLKKNKLKTKLNKKDFEIIKLFIKLGVIKFIKREREPNTYFIYFRYIKNDVIFNNIKNIYKPSKPTLISLKEINTINKKKNNIFVISTQKGLITNFEAKKNNTGGILVFLIHI